MRGSRVIPTPGKRVHSDDVIEKMRAMWDEGHSLTTIAGRMTDDGYKITSNAVVGVAHRNGFTPRPSPVTKASASIRMADRRKPCD